ncbi:hypothetical protein EV426DRAFT_701089 [Tirmania nivea]|nr:hypothetical protein EV426DRAFT_701089 [Tirmania nivea]
MAAMLSVGVIFAGFGLCIVFAVLNGAVCWTCWTTITPVTAEIVGLKELPSALSVVWLSTLLPTTFSVAVALALRRPELVKAGAKRASGVMWVLRARLVGEEGSWEGGGMRGGARGG